MSNPPVVGGIRRWNAVAGSMLALGVLAPALAQAASPWTNVSVREPGGAGSKAWVRPQRFRAVRVDRVSLRAQLRRAVAERPEEVLAPALDIDLPMPDGSSARFRIVESPVMAPELAAKFPEIKTYRGQGVDDPSAALRLDVTPAGVHAQVLSPSGAVYLDPYGQDDPDLLVSYYKRDYRKETDGFVCGVQDGSAAIPTKSAEARASGGTLRTYRLACAGTGEYVQFHGGTVPAGLAAIVTTVNRVTGIYERDVAVRLCLVGNNDLLVYTNSATDPYTNNDRDAMLEENQANADAVIGEANYDVGHVFSSTDGGVAWYGVCVAEYKAQGVTGSSSPFGDPFDVDYVAHEMGHQFGANHTFNGLGCSGRNASTAYEPGSGSTIMGYAGVCGSDDLQPHSDPYFHFASCEEIVAYTTSGDGSTCPTNSATGNTPPTLGALTNYTIPCRTPFVLTASGNDPDSDPLTYCWEEADLGPAQALTAGDNGSSPLFRSFNPTSAPFRVFPSLTNILNNTTSRVEKLPTTTRALKFKVTVRDNRSGGGGVNSTSVTLSVTSNAGPFRVTSPNSTQTLSGRIPVTWQVAGTTSSPVNCAAVDILLSTNGGRTFSTVLVTNTPNDGSASAVLPHLATSQARLEVRARDNVFFDVSDTNFSIVPGVPVALESATFTDTMGNANGVLEPGEPIEESLVLRNTGDPTVVGVTAVVSAVDAGITMIQATSAYAAIAAGGLGTNVVPFRYQVAKSVPCATMLTFSVAMITTNGIATDTFVRTVGRFGYGAPQTGTFESVDVPMFIADLAMSTSTLTIASGGIVDDINVSVRINHSWDGDLQIYLRHPDGTSVMLADQRGGGGANFGTGDCVCAAYTVFDDGADTPISSGLPPFEGTYRPDGVLSNFNGNELAGVWRLQIYDTWSTDSGTCLCWSVRAVYRPSESTCEIFNHAPVISGGGVTPASPATTQDLAAAATATDPDGEPVTLFYAWQSSADNASFGDAGGTDSNYPAASTAAGWYYRCVMTPGDGYSMGAAWTTAAVRVLVDSDSDGLDDDWEMEHFRSLTAQDGGGDADGDRLLNWEEAVAGTEPTNDASFFQCLEISGEDFPMIGKVLRWNAVSGRVYSVDGNTNLPEGWFELATNLPPAGVWTDTTHGAGGGVNYRLGVERP